MIILLKNKDTLHVEDFKFKCSIGKMGTTSKKIEGDKKTPKGIFSLDKLYYRKDKFKKPHTKLKCIPIKKNMGWCNDLGNPNKYNTIIKKDKKIKHETMFRSDSKYDFIIPIKYNFKKPILVKVVQFLYILQMIINQRLCCSQITRFLILIKILKKYKNKNYLVLSKIF